ncbi:DUF1127 domain-containing protein [Sulfitobacter sp. PS-8MA]|uniref:DUF1127 domain-containing protein n=1 Tax=Sulfitobacter sp. PS-8MA TaxID=3237707 RepID=UPI0034C6C2DD
MTQARPLSADAMTLMTYRALPVPAVIALRFAAAVTTWATRRRTRLALAALEPWQLQDAGLTPEQASKEASRVFWQA